MSITQKILGSGILFFITIGSGIWLSNIGRPYNTLVFTIHKLIALLAVIFIAVLIRPLFKNLGIKGFIILLIVIAGLAILSLFVSGALLSIGNVPYMLVKRIHVIATIIAVAAIVASFFFLIRERM